MNMKASNVLQKLYKNSTREGQVRLVSTHDVTNSPVHFCNWSLACSGYKVLKLFTKKSLTILLTKTTAVQNEASLSYLIVMM